MALQQSYTLPIGSNVSFLYPQFQLCISNSEYVLQNAYIKIVSLSGSKSNIKLNIGIFDKKDGTFVISDSFEFIPDLTINAKNFIEQGYIQLKTYKYTQAVDLLDDGQVG